MVDICTYLLELEGVIFGPKLCLRGCVEQSVHQSGPVTVVCPSVISDKADVTSVDTKVD